jgi:GT2 family glycosyltransferase
MVKLSVICVVYNIVPSKCSTLTSLESLDLSSYDIKINIWDNSADGFGADSLSFMVLPSSYQHSNKNSSLAEAYNQIIKVDSSADYYIILDDDSVITQEYFEALMIFVKTGKELALPKISHSGKLISPGKIKGVRGVELLACELKI